MAATDDRTQETNEYREPQNMMWLWGQLMMIPAAALVYSVEILLRTMQSMQQITNQGLNVMAGPMAGSNRMFDEQEAPDTEVTGQKNSNMNNRNEEETLNNDNFNYCNPDQKGGKCLKLWRYKVLFIKRDLEHAFDEAEDLVPDDVQDITAWKIAEFIQKLAAADKVVVPWKWLDHHYPRLEYLRINGKAPTSQKEVDEARNARIPIYLWGLPEEDKRFLRLFAQVLAQYTREDPQYDKQQVEVLREIANKLG